MIGLPNSGRTTFLAALWHQVESAETATAFTADRLQPDREYLNRIRSSWLQLEEIPRTPVGIDNGALLQLRHTASQARYDVSIPDMAGETFAMQWSDRRISRQYQEQLKRSFGLMLFVHSQQVVPAETLVAAPLEASPNEYIEWIPRLAPTQVQLVDFLQTAIRVVDGRGIRVAIVVSAWDEVPEPTTPTAWLERQLPLLDQFRVANPEVVGSEVFGVSAIGGQLSDREVLAARSLPSNRAKVHVGSSVVSDLTLPLDFLTSGKLRL